VHFDTREAVKPLPTLSQQGNFSPDLKMIVLATDATTRAFDEAIELEDISAFSVKGRQLKIVVFRLV